MAGRTPPGRPDNPDHDSGTVSHKGPIFTFPSASRPLPNFKKKPDRKECEGQVFTHGGNVLTSYARTFLTDSYAHLTHD